jgi:hypothetical protein
VNNSLASFDSAFHGFLNLRVYSSDSPLSNALTIEAEADFAMFVDFNRQYHSLRSRWQLAGNFGLAMPVNLPAKGY